MSNQKVIDNIGNALNDLNKALGALADEKNVAYYIQGAITSLNVAKAEASKAAIRAANGTSVNIGGTQVFGGSKTIGSDDKS